MTKQAFSAAAVAVAAIATGMAITSTSAVQGPGGGRGFGGVQPDRELVAQFDKDGNKRLDAAERQAAREYVLAQGGGRGGFGGRGGRGFPGAEAGPVEPGPKLDKASVKPVAASVPFYDQATLRTLFFDFENDVWEQELTAFKDTDVEVPARLTVDGKVYEDVGVSFRGASSFGMVPEGRKRSLNVSIDFAKDQHLLGYRSLNLLNAHEDPTFVRTVLYLDAARAFIPAAKANFVRVVLNGESWGVYVNVEQVNKDFVNTWYKTEDGARWKVPGSPGGRGGLEYVGDDIAQYKRTYEIKSKDNQKSWAALVNLTKVLNETPLDRLESALAPILDIDETLKFLALEVALVNNDGYWVRASDYNIYLDPKGVFHILPHDVNEAFAPAGGRGRGPGRMGPPPGGRGDILIGPGGPPPPGFPGGPGGRGFMMGGNATLDPLVGLDDPTKPLRSRLLAVPSLRAKYLAYTKEIATRWLDWRTLEPRIKQYQSLIAADVKTDTRKLESFEAFGSGVDQLRQFAETRRALLLSYQPPQ
jgi:spore coat protein CotH